MKRNIPLTIFVMAFILACLSAQAQITPGQPATLYEDTINCKRQDELNATDL